jgi:hypothetical protein
MKACCVASGNAGVALLWPPTMDNAIQIFQAGFKFHFPFCPTAAHPAALHKI